MKTRSIRFKLIAMYAVVSVLVYIGLGTYTYYELHRYLSSALEANLIRRANLIGDRLISNIGTLGEAKIVDEIQTLYSPELNDRFIRITKPDGTILYSSGEPADKSFDPKKITRQTGSYYTEGTFSFPDQHLLLILRKVLIPNASYLLVEVGSSTLESERVLKDFFVILLLGLPAILILVVVSGLVLINRTLVRVERVTHAAQEITFHNLKKRLPVSQTGDEIEYLTIALNQMIERLDDAFQHASRFTADASHELRTPLTIMHGELESVIQDVSLGKASRDKIYSVLEETEHLAKIVEQLFAISRLEAGEATLERTRFDLSDLVVMTTDQMHLLAEEKKIVIKSCAGECLEVNGDRGLIKQVVVNLLDNAIKYSPEGGTIWLKTRKEKDCAIFEVTDSGQGIPESALPRVFDRFYRADEVRTHREQGAGLGLSIVRSICQVHDGSISAANTQDAGCRVTVRLPLVSANIQNGFHLLSLR